MVEEGDRIVITGATPTDKLVWAKYKGEKLGIQAMRMLLMPMKSPEQIKTDIRDACDNLIFTFPLDQRKAIERPSILVSTILRMVYTMHLDPTDTDELVCSQLSGIIERLGDLADKRKAQRIAAQNESLQQASREVQEVTSAKVET